MTSLWNLTQCCMPMTCKSQSRPRKKVKYVPPPKTESCKPAREYIPSELKMEDRTVYTMSYSTNNIKKQDSCPCKGSNECCQPPEFQQQCMVCPCLFDQEPMWTCSDQTVHRASYQQWGPFKPEEMPWKRKPDYIPPKVKMDDQTVQKLSYAPPGEFVEYTDDESDCVFCPPIPPCEGPNICCRDRWCQNFVCNNESEVAFLH